MSEAVRLRLGRPLRRVRLHAGGAAGVASPQSRWLVGARERQQADAEQAEAIERCLRAVKDAIDAVPAIVERNLQEVAAMATEIGLAVARELLGDSIERGTYDPNPTVLRCLKSVVLGADSGEIQVFLAAEDLSSVAGRLSESSELHDWLDRISLAVDPELSRGSVRVESGSGSLIYDPRAVFERIALAVREETSH